MSTSSRPAPQPEVRSFPYPEAAGTEASGGAACERPPVGGDEEAAAREAARREGEMQARAVFDQQVAQVRESVRCALQDFADQRTAYYRQVEHEVVQLALSIARKVLHREVQVDPLLLGGMVRVALDQVESGTKVVVRVHPEQVEEMRSYFVRTLEPGGVPEVCEDASVARDCCFLQTELGTTELGVEAQSKEIENGLMDLMARRPEATR
jgi:flagellar assembly protein FliH